MPSLISFIGRPLTPQAVDEETFNDMQDAVPTCLHLIHRYVRPRLIPPTPQRAPIAAPKNIVAAKIIQRSSLWAETTIFSQPSAASPHDFLFPSPVDCRCQHNGGEDFACSVAQVYCNAAIESKYVETGT